MRYRVSGFNLLPCFSGLFEVIYAGRDNVYDLRKFLILVFSCILDDAMWCIQQAKIDGTAYLVGILLLPYPLFIFRTMWIPSEFDHHSNFVILYDLTRLSSTTSFVAFYELFFHNVFDCRGHVANNYGCIVTPRSLFVYP